MPFLYTFTLPGNNRGTGGEMAEGYYLSLICIELNDLLTHVLICPYFSEVMPFIDGTSHLIIVQLFKSTNCLVHTNLLTYHCREVAVI